MAGAMIGGLRRGRREGGDPQTERQRGPAQGMRCRRRKATRSTIDMGRGYVGGALLVCARRHAVTGWARSSPRLATVFPARGGRRYGIGDEHPRITSTVVRVAATTAGGGSCDGLGPGRERWYGCTRRAEARIGGLKVTESVCPFCAVGCGQVVYTRGGELVDIEGIPVRRSTRARCARRVRRRASWCSSRGG